MALKFLPKKPQIEFLISNQEFKFMILLGLLVRDLNTVFLNLAVDYNFGNKM